MNAKCCVTAEDDDRIHWGSGEEIANEFSRSEGAIDTTSRKSLMLKQEPAIFETPVISRKRNLCGRDRMQAAVYDKAA
jgi:hypothetical protein